MFFKRIFRKPEPAKPVAEKLSIGDFRERLEKLKAEKLENIKPQLNAALDGMAGERERILNELKALAEAGSSEEVHPGLMKTAMEARKLFVDKMTRALDLEHRPEFSVAALAAFDGKLTKATNLTTDAMVIHGRYVRTVFEPNFAIIQSHLRGLHEMARQIHTVIEGIVSKIRELDSILSEIESQTTLVQNLEKLHEDINSLEHRAKETEERLKKEGEQLTRLMSSEEFKRAADSRRELERSELERRRVEGQVASAFSDISRPLRKLERLVSSGGHQMDRELVRTLKLCISDPVTVISSDEKISAAEALLQEAAKLLAERKIDLADRERRKKLERTKELAAGLREFKGRLDLLTRQLEAQRQVLAHPVQKQAAELERSIGQCEYELKEARALIEEFGRKAGLTKDEIEAKRVKLEEMAGETFGTKIELTS